MIWTGQIECGLAGGMDVTSNTPVHIERTLLTLSNYQSKMQWTNENLGNVESQGSIAQSSWSLKRYTGKTMGLHAEEMAQYFCVFREEQENFSISSHQSTPDDTRWKIKEQIIPIENRGYNPVWQKMLIRSSMKKEKLQKMRPVFDRRNGTITAFIISFDRWCLLCCWCLRNMQKKWAILLWVLFVLLPFLPDPRRTCYWAI